MPRVSDMIDEVKQENIISRQPVVVVMGHVDHGKSSLLEAIKEDFVICAKESGGITQHIGAYEVEIGNPPSPKATDGQRKITFIDTPGHEAFSAMRARGAGVADIALLVIDASEGVKAQTKEAINFIKKAGIPMIVVFNKIDKSGADPEKVKQELSREDILVESWGGKIPSCNVSAKNRQGINELLDTILLVAEMEDLKTDTTKPVRGTVIESSLDKQKGPVATLILREGILRKGDVIATHSVVGKIKGLDDFQGRPLENVLPAQPALALGFDNTPGVGEEFKVFANREEAQANVEIKKREWAGSEVVESDENVKILNIIVKTDVFGSSEAVEGILKNLPQERVALRILKSEIGDINIVDIQLAESGRARIFGFRVKVDKKASLFARQKGVRIKLFDVIYELVQEVRLQMTNALEPEIKRIDLAKFEITVLFKGGKDNQIVGGRVIEGEITKNTQVEIFREEEMVGQGRIKNIQQDKKDVGKVVQGKEAALLLSSNIKTKEGDVLVVFREEKEKGTL